MNNRLFLNWVELLRDRASRQPGKTAFTFLEDGGAASQTLTFQQLDRRARAIAACLQRLSAAGQRALLLYPPGLDYVAAFHGCLYAGVIAVPLYPPQKRKLSTIEAIAADSQATLVLTDSRTLERSASRLASSPALSKLRCLATDEIGDALAEEWREEPLESHTTAYLQYTSGSTSSPKGVVIGHDTALEQCADLALSWDVGPESVTVSWLPHFHDFGHVGGVLLPLYSGGHCVLMSPVSFIQQPLRWLQAISEYRGTHAAAPNFAYDHCVDNIDPEARAALDLSCWRTAPTGAEPVRKSTLERFHAAFASQGFRWNSLCPGYGLAEATLKVASSPPDASPVIGTFDAESLGRNRVVESTEENGKTLVGCGGTVLDTRVVIVDPQALREVSSNQVGEIWVRGPGVGRGYWNRPEETRRTFQARLADTGEGPFLRTGDLGFVKDGELYISGRLKDLLIIRGTNHYPQDIELTVEQSHPLLRPGAGAAFSIEQQSQERLVVVMERRRFYPHVFDPAEVFQAIREAVSREHGVEAHALLLLATGSIPKTTSGKLQRRECWRRFLAGELDVVAEWRDTPASEAPHPERKTRPAASDNSLRELIRSGLRNKLVSWMEKEGKASAAEVDLGSSLAAHGVDSMSMFGLHAELERWSGRPIPPEWLWEAPSIETLIQQLSEFDSRSVR